MRRGLVVLAVVATALSLTGMAQAATPQPYLVGAARHSINPDPDGTFAGKPVYLGGYGIGGGSPVLAGRPATGVLGKKSVNVGERVQPGQQIVPLTHTGRLWVTANFRETQIRLMKPGQKASIHVDAIDRDYGGVVESFSGATGSRYSLLPPENASGNYVKVVQRLPVRITIDPGQPELERLRPGMSVEPKVRVR